MNNTQHPHKPGCTFRGNFTGKAAALLEEVQVPVESMAPFETHCLLVPIKIKDNAQLTANSGEDHHVASFSFQGPRGWSFGEEFKIKFKVEKKFDEIEFYNCAMKIFEDMKRPNSGTEHITFEKVVEVLKKTKNDEKLCREVLSQMSSKSNDEDMFNF